MAENTARTVIKFIGEHWTGIYTAFDVLKGIFGKQSTPPENAPPEVKRVAGLFGTGDEIKFINHVLEMSPEDQEILLGLVQYHFGPVNRPKTWLWVLVTYAQSNKWRKLITDLDSPSQKVGTKKMVRNVNLPEADGVAKNSTENITTEEDLFRGEAKKTREFLKRLVEIIKLEKAKPEGTLEKGYEVAVAYMRSLGVPLMPKPETIEWVQKNLPDVTDWVSKTSGFTKNWISQQAEENRQREAAMWWGRRWFRKLIS